MQRPIDLALPRAHCVSATTKHIVLFANFMGTSSWNRFAKTALGKMAIILEYFVF